MIFCRYLAQAHYPCSYSNEPNFSTFSDFTATGVPFSTLELLLKCRLGVWVPLQPTLPVSYPSSSTNYNTVAKLSSAE